MKRFWKSCLLIGLLLGGPATAERTWFMEPTRDHMIEVLLEQAPSALVMDTLRETYPKVEFFAHHSKNGFYARGSQSELKALRRAAGVLDVIPQPPHPLVRELVVRELHTLPTPVTEELLTRLDRLVPSVRVDSKPGSQLLMLEGSPEALSYVRELISCPCDLGEPVLMMQVRLLDISEWGRKKLGPHSGPSGGPSVYAPSKDTYQEFVNGVETFRYDASPAGAFGTDSR